MSGEQPKNLPETTPVTSVENPAPQNPTSVITDFIKSLPTLFPNGLDGVMKQWNRRKLYHDLVIAIFGGLVLGAAMIAGALGHWELTEKVAIAVISFFAGIFAARGK